MALTVDPLERRVFINRYKGREGHSGVKINKLIHTADCTVICTIYSTIFLPPFTSTHQPQHRYLLSLLWLFFYSLLSPISNFYFGSFEVFDAWSSSRSLNLSSTFIVKVVGVADLGRQRPFSFHSFYTSQISPRIMSGMEEKQRLSGESPRNEAESVLPTINPATEKPEPPKAALHPAFYISIWIAMSSTVILFNKWILDTGKFPYPILLTTWHLAFGTLMTQILARTTTLLDGRKKVKMTGRVYLRAIVPIGLFFSLSLICGNITYLYLSVAFIQMLKVSGHKSLNDASADATTRLLHLSQHCSALGVWDWRNQT